LGAPWAILVVSTLVTLLVSPWEVLAPSASVVLSVSMKEAIIGVAKRQLEAQELPTLPRPLFNDLFHHPVLPFSS
jgi:hypothetical protein